MKDIHRKDIIDGKLEVSYEAPHFVTPAMAVLLLTRCCPLNHEHIELDKEEARLLGQWLTEFANGVYDIEV